jgi:hypothetical protein
MKWKYTRVLEFALRQKVRARDLESFIRNNGGLNAVIELAAASSADSE